MIFIPLGPLMKISEKTSEPVSVKPKVEIEKFEGLKPWLGGYRHKVEKIGTAIYYIYLTVMIFTESPLEFWNRYHL